MICIRKHILIIFFKCRNEIKSNLANFKGYKGLQIGPKRKKISQNREFLYTFGPDNSIKPLNMNDLYQKT